MVFAAKVRDDDDAEHIADPCCLVFPRLIHRHLRRDAGREVDALQLTALDCAAWRPSERHSASEVKPTMHFPHRSKHNMFPMTCCASGRLYERVPLQLASQEVVHPKTVVLMDDRSCLKPCILARLVTNTLLHWVFDHEKHQQVVASKRCCSRAPSSKLRTRLPVPTPKPTQDTRAATHTQ